MGEKRQRSESVDELTHGDHIPQPLVQRPRKKVQRRLRHEDYTIAWICPLYFELASAIAMLDEEHEGLPRRTRDSNHYILGRIGHHNIVIAGLNQGHYGVVRATRVLSDLQTTFPLVSRCLLVGIGGGFPELPYQDIRLGDVVVGERIKCYDEGKAEEGGHFERTGDTMRPPDDMATALLLLRARHEHTATATNIVNLVQTKLSSSSGYQHPGTKDQLFLHNYRHIYSPEGCRKCLPKYTVKRPDRPTQGPRVHYGTIASGSIVFKDGVLRDRIRKELGVMCAETEAAGFMNLVPTLVIRGVSDYADGHKNDNFQKYAAANAAAFALEFLGCLKPIQTHQPTEAESDMSSRIEKGEAEKVKKSRETRLASIRFDHMSSRQFGITGRLTSTCQWLLEHKSYLSWRDDSQLAKHLGFLWLKGKPGAGKSTLMRFAYEEHKRLEGRRQRTPNTVIAAFFFHARGEELQRSVTGMYRSLVYQLFKGFPHLGELLDDTELLSFSETECPSLDQLLELFQRGISCLGPRQFICYVDALDECNEKDVFHMAQVFQSLAEEHNQQGPRFRVFFSSRHYPHISSRIGLQLELDNQPGHSDDLKQYTERRLLYEDDVIRRVLVEKSRGVFMWLVLVIDILNKDHAGGLLLSAASKKLRDLPEDLSALFGEILRRHDSHKDEFIIAVVWILFATRPLTPKELEHAIWSDQADDEAADMLCSDKSPEKSAKRLRQRRTIMQTAKETDRLRQRVTRSSKGLAEVITHEGSSAVQFIHESVRDFLLKDQGLIQVWPEAGPHIIHYGHEKLKRCCANYISSAKIWKDFSKATVNNMDDLSILKSYSFLEYAVKNIFHHAEQAEPVVRQTQFLRTLAMEPLTNCLAIFDRNGQAFRRRECDILYLLAEGGHARLINALDEVLPMSCTLGGKYGSALIVALAGKHTEAISALLKLPTALCTRAQLLNGPGDRRKLRPGWDRSLLSWAAEGAHTELIRVLLGRGARINELDPGGYTALARAVLKLSEYKPTTNTVTFLDREAHTRGPAISMLLRNGAGWDIHAAISLAKNGQLPPPGSGTKIDDRSRFRWTLFEWSTLERNLQDLLFMCEGGNHGKNTYLLHHAARRGRMEAVKLLTDSCNGISLRPNLPQPYSYDTPLAEALSNGHTSVFELLQAKSSVACDEGRFYASLFWSPVAQDRLQSLKLLVGKGFTPNWHLDYGAAPLALAARRGSIKVAEWLLETGAAIEGRDEEGRTPLMMASIEGRPAMVKMLLQHDADCQAKTPDGWSPLMLACRYCASGFRIAPYRSASEPEPVPYEAVRCLIQDGADVNARGKSGDTALRLAVEWGDHRLVRLLLLAGADITTRDDQDRTILECATPRRPSPRREANILALQQHLESLLK